MGILRSLVSGKPDPVLDFAAGAGESFAVDATSIPPEVFGLTAYAAPTAIAPRVTRREAVQVPAVKRSRDLICGALGGLPLVVVKSDFTIDENSAWLDQPERNVPRSVSMTRLAEDMLYDGIGWWRITESFFDDYPARVERLGYGRVVVDETAGVGGKVYVDGIDTPQDTLIRFDSPNDPLLVAGARAIRQCLLLDQAAQRYADGTPPGDFFTPDDGQVDPFDDDAETVEFLNSWEAARRSRSTGWVPAAVKYHNNPFDPKALELAEQRQHAVLEVARAAGIDPEELGVSTTSRTYANQQDRRKAFIDFTLGGYLRAIEDRLTMRDVTRRGATVRFDLSDFLRSDDKTRFETYRLGIDVGAIDPDEIRPAERKPALTRPASKSASTPTSDNPGDNVITLPVSAHADAPSITGLTFDTDPDVTLDAAASDTFEVNAEKRTIRGLAVPYGKVGVSNGRKFQFSRGSLKFGDVKRVKLWVQHDRNQAVGVATKLDDRDDGLYAEFSVARGAEGDRILNLAEDGVLDGLSIGLGAGAQFSTRDGINHAVAGGVPLMEISLTPAPSFDDARLVGAGFGADQAGPTFEGIGTEIRKAMLQGFSDLGANPLGNPQQREQVSAAGGTFEVNEALPYRFDGIGSEHSFVADLRASASGDAEAKQRLETFMAEAFAVTPANVTALNPTINRPELYVPNLEFTRPLWGLVSTGVVSDVTPFTIPKFAGAAGLVGPHVAGVEPTPGSFSATNQTITPAPVSGKVEILREVWDQGGNPKADAIIWREMVNGYYEAIEAKIATMLNALALVEINLASATNAALVTAVQNIFVDLQFVRGGNRYSAMALDGMLFKALVAAQDSTGRNLLPVLSPANADGTTSADFSVLAIGSQKAVAAWPLGATNASNSYLFVPGSVWAWASAPQKFTFEYQVKSIDMAVWGYTASAVLRDTDVKRIDYTTADV